MSLLLIVGVICLGAMIAGFVINQSLILLVTGTGWIIFGVLMYNSATTTSLSIALFALGASFAILCFVWPLIIWTRTRTVHLSPEEQDYEDHRRKVEELTRR